LCSECGERFDDLEPGHSHEILDSRWADLAAKFGVPGPSGARTSTLSSDGIDPDAGAISNN
jgi:uncharacterized protein